MYQNICIHEKNICILDLYHKGKKIQFLKKSPQTISKIIIRIVATKSWTMTRVIKKLKTPNMERRKGRNIWTSWLVSILQLISCNTIQDLKRQNMGNQNSKVRFP